MELQYDKLLIEVDSIKKIMNLLSSLFEMRAAYIYDYNESAYVKDLTTHMLDDDSAYVKEIAGVRGYYQEYCRVIQEEMKERCIACDIEKFTEAKDTKKRVLYKCCNGLYEMYLPLFIENTFAGYLHFGQIRCEEDFNIIAQECALYEHSKIKKLKKIYNSMKIIEKDKLNLIADLFQMFSEIILKNKFIELRQTDPEFYLMKYIHDNYSSRITIQTAATYINRSPSYVIHKFKEKFKSSFHQYLTKFRIDKAKNFMKRYSISQTYQLCGFENRYHFSKVFKKHEGLSPREFQLNLK